MNMATLLKKAKKPLHLWCRGRYLRRQREQFHNPTLSVFSSNCVGGCMLHDLNTRFNSPFVNLFLNAEDYLKFLADPHHYSALELQEIPADTGYPVGRWGDLTVHFVHYPDFATAADTFRRRLARVDYDNLFVIFSERDGCTYADLQTFDALPYAHKVVFTHRPYERISSAFYIEGFEQADCLGDILKWDTKTGRKIYDRFPFATWLNGET